MTLQSEPITVNLGPHHPSTHGVFRVRVVFDGEVIQDVEPIFGYLHRGSEKLAEERTWTQVVTLTDRLDYTASMSNNLAYVIGVERLLGVEVPERGQYIRVLMAELMRIASHQVATGFFLQDLGAFATPLMYMFRDRERILDLFEMVCGARITHTYMRAGGVNDDLPPEFFPALAEVVNELPRKFDEYEQLMRENEILISRCKGVGVLPLDLAVNAGATGPVLRASGLAWDLRKSDPYEVYDRFEFDIPTGSDGDNYDRFLVRLEGDAPEPAHHPPMRGADAAGAAPHGPSHAAAPARRRGLRKGRSAPRASSVSTW